MKKFLSIFIAVAMVMSFAAMFGHAPAAMASGPSGPQNGMNITSPTAGSTVTTDPLSVSGTFDTSYPAGYTVVLTVTANSVSNTYNYTLPATQSTWGPISVPASDFGLVTDGSQSYPTKAEAVLQDTNGIPVTDIDTGEVDFTWQPGGTPAPTNICCMDLTDSKTDVDYYDPVPDFGSAGAVQALTDQYVYKMGDTIHGCILNSDGTEYKPVDPWRVELRKTNGDVVDTVDMEAGSSDFTIGTGNVSLDGEYYVVPVVDDEDYCSTTVYIQYNLTWKSKDITACDDTQTISGWITRGNGQTVLVPVSVYVAYPDDSLAGYYTIAPSSSGQFTITFPLNNYIGDFNIYLRDGYDPANDDNDAMIYDTLSNVPSTSITLSTYVSPTILYKNQDSQPIVLSLTDQDGNYVSGATFDVEYTDGTAATYAVHEISEGFYRFVVDTTDVTQPDIRFTAHYTMYGKALTSNMVIVTLRDKNVFNPYVDVNAIHSIDPYGDGPTECTDDLARDVYDKLPCTIGNALEVNVGVWSVTDPANWYRYDVETSVDGPVTDLGEGRYLVEKAGKITASVSVTAWQRANTDCPAFDSEGITEEEMSTNACCHEYSKTFDICEVASCTVDKVSLENGAQTDDTTIQVGKSADLVLSIGNQSAPADLECGCNSKIVHIYMTNDCDVLGNGANTGNGSNDCGTCSNGNGNGNAPLGVFTMNTYGGGTKDVDEIWWNPVGAKDTGIADLPITFGKTDTDLKIYDNCSTLTFEGFTPNYVNDTDCDITL